MSTHYDVVAEPEGRWWIVRVPSLEITGQARNLAEVDDVAAEIIGLWLDCPTSEITTTVTLKIPDSIQKILDKASTQEKEAEQLARDARATRSAALHQLVDGGLTITDTAKLVKLSRQRVSQLVTA